MRGIEISRTFFFEKVLPELKKEFPDRYSELQIGKVGRGSECYGYDDKYSADHDYTAGIQFYLTEEQDLEYGFKLTRFYSRFIKNNTQSYYRERREGVFSISEFLTSIIGFSALPQKAEDWLSIPEHALFELTNGEIFQEGSGEFVKIRKEAMFGIPLDVYKKRISAHMILASQNGEYNYQRILKHGEELAANFALHDFVNHISHLVFELNKQPTPYFKWRFKKMKELEWGDEITTLLESLLLDNESEKIKIIDIIKDKICKKAYDEGYTKKPASSLEEASFMTKEGIENQKLKKLHIMEY